MQPNHSQRRSQPAGTAPTPEQPRWDQGKGRAHLCERSGHSSAAFPMEVKRGGQCWMSSHGSAPHSRPERGWVGTGLVRWCFGPQTEGVCGGFVLQHPRSSWGRTSQEMLRNDLSPALPGSAEATAPGTEGMAKPKSVGGPSRRSQATCHQLSPATAEIFPACQPELCGVFFHQSKFQAPVLVLCTC